MHFHIVPKWNPVSIVEVQLYELLYSHSFILSNKDVNIYKIIYQVRQSY